MRGGGEQAGRAGREPEPSKVEVEFEDKSAYRFHTTWMKDLAQLPQPREGPLVNTGSRKWQRGA